MFNFYFGSYVFMWYKKRILAEWLGIYVHNIPNVGDWCETKSMWGRVEKSIGIKTDFLKLLL